MTITIKPSEQELTELSRQTSESYVEIDPTQELEMGHISALLVLGSVDKVSISPEMAGDVGEALESAKDLLAMTIVEWHWLDRAGKPCQKPDTLEAFNGLKMSEVNWLLEKVSESIKEYAAPKKT